MTAAAPITIIVARYQQADQSQTRQSSNLEGAQPGGLDLL